MKTPKFWAKKNIIAEVLVPFSVLYFWGMRLHQRRTKKKKIAYFPNLHIICVGNVTAGGAGKTPLCLALHHMLKNNAPCILTKGYKRKTMGTFKIQKNHTAYDAGDEAFMLHQHANVIVCDTRAEGCKLAESLGYRTIIWDDGLHDHSVKKNIHITIMHQDYGIGNGYLLPAGPLRDRLDIGLKNTDILLTVGGENIPQRVEQDLPKKAKRFVVFGQIAIPTLPKGKKIIAVAGIAHPERFFTSLAEKGIVCSKKLTFSDHYAYSKKDIRKINNLLAAHDSILLTTQKDMAKLAKYKTMFQSELYVVDYTLTIPETQALKKLCEK